ncbi:hypothetical protein COI96_24330 [Priestia megaterium]|nr:hypothetical protein COI96_24330 [Priestia megaterium]
MMKRNIEIISILFTAAFLIGIISETVLYNATFYYINDIVGLVIVTGAVIVIVFKRSTSMFIVYMLVLFSVCIVLVYLNYKVL